MLRLLAAHPACEVEPLSVNVWPATAAGYRAFGRIDLAVALLTATTGDGYVLTAEPDAYGAPGEDTIIPI